MRKLGYLPSPKDVGGTHTFEKLMGASGPLPESASVKPYVVDVLDQLGTNSCVANSTAQALRIAMRVQGVSHPPLPSRRFIYTMAQLYAGQTLADFGTYPHAALGAIADVGFPPESVCPFDEASISIEPDWRAKQAGFDQRSVAPISGYARSFGDNAESIKQALAQRHPVIFGSDVDDPFMNLGSGEVWPGVRGTVQGGHALCCVSYDARGIEVVNSWNTSWSSGGYGWMSWDAVEEFSDVWVIKLAPAFSDAGGNS